MKVKHQIIKSLVITLLSTLGLISCNIKEDMSDCPGYIVLDYSNYPTSILDEIDPEAKVYIYIFDASDVCSDILTYTYAELEAREFFIEVPILYRSRNAVAWHVESQTQYSHPTMVVGAPLADFYLSLNQTNNIFEQKTKGLWASPLELVDFCASKTRHRIYMTRINTEIDLTLKQKTTDTTTTLNPSDYKITIDAINNIYYRDYTIDSESSLVQYNNNQERLDSPIIDTAQLGTLRVSTQSDCILKIENNQGETVTIAGEDELELKQYMLNTKTDNTQEDQEFLDLNKKWEIELLIDQDQTAIALTINGWTVWFSGSDLN